MKIMRPGFTMIELIFVIVIIGILAAVAIPKLAATRDDAKIAEIIANTRTVLSDMSAFYTSKGNSIWTDSNTTNDLVTNVTLYRDNCDTPINIPVAGGVFDICDEKTSTGIPCIRFQADAAGTQIIVYNQINTSSPICNAVATDPSIMGITGPDRGGHKVYKLGSSIVR